MALQGSHILNYARGESPGINADWQTCGSDRKILTRSTTENARSSSRRYAMPMSQSSHKNDGVRVVLFSVPSPRVSVVLRVKFCGSQIVLELAFSPTDDRSRLVWAGGLCSVERDVCILKVMPGQVQSCTGFVLEVVTPPSYWTGWPGRAVP